jgi:hypothetical protein
VSNPGDAIRLVLASVTIIERFTFRDPYGQLLKQEAEGRPMLDDEGEGV